MPYRRALVSLFGLVSLVALLSACAGASSSVTRPPAPSPTATLAPTAEPTPPAREVTFTTPDGATLGGVIYGTGRTALIMANQMDGTEVSWMPFAQRAANRGYLALTFDYRGHGSSKGTFDSSKLDIDVRAAMAFMRKQGATRIGLIGASIGGAAVARAASQERVDAVVVISGPIDWPELPVSDTVLARLSAPALFINCKFDAYAGDTQRMYDAAAQPKQLQIYPCADHGTAIVNGTRAQESRQLILDFLASHVPARE